jgi:hypothetical protein
LITTTGLNELLNIHHTSAVVEARFMFVPGIPLGGAQKLEREGVDQN